MAKKQSRRSISIRGTTYAAVRDDCAASSISMSDYIEQLIANDRAARGLVRPAPYTPLVPGSGMHAHVKAAVRAVERESAKAARSPLPSTSSIKAGPPPEQTAMLGRQETPARSMVPACPCCGRQSMRAGVRCGVCAIGCTRLGEGWKRGKMCPARAPMVDLEEPAEGEADEDLAALEEVTPKPSRGNAWRGKMAPRPEEAEARRAARTAAPPPIPEGTNLAMPGRPAGLRVEAAKARPVEEVKRIVKVDPIAAVHAGRSGVQF